MGIRTMMHTSRCPHRKRSLECSVEAETEFDKSCGYPIHRYSSMIGSGYWRGVSAVTGRLIVREMYHEIKREQADIVFSCASRLQGLSTLVAAWLSRTPAIRVIHTCGSQSRRLANKGF